MHRSPRIRPWHAALHRALLAVSLLNAAPACAADAQVSRSLEALFAEVNPSVVLVRTRKTSVIAGDGPVVLPMIDLGSGVLISEKGDVLTAAHLVQVADVVRVEFADGTDVSATVVTSDPAADLALLRLDDVPEGAVVARLGDSDRARVGQPVFVIGAPFGLSHTLTVGHLSARHTPGTMVGPHNLAEFFQVDAAINRGNSGGPVFDMDGEVIGIVSYILSRSGTFEGVGFAVTTNSIRDLLLSRRMPWSGISVFALDRTMARLFNLPQNGGLLVQQVARGSPGAKLGLVPGYVPARIGDYELLIGGDVILSVDGIEVDGDGGDTYRKLRAHLAEVPTGGTVTVRVMRHGRIIDLATVRED